jgi:hypothetical protein
MRGRRAEGDGAAPANLGTRRDPSSVASGDTFSRKGRRKLEMNAS